MIAKRLQFNEIEVPIVKGHEKVIDKATKLLNNILNKS